MTVPNELAGEVPGLSGFVVMKYILGDQDAVNFIGPVGKSQGAGPEVHRREW